MKRAFYEWGAITTSTLALVCFSYWVVSLSTPLADFEVFLPLGHWKSTQILASSGTITINDHLGSKKQIEDLVKYRIVNPPFASKTRWALPGFLYQSIGWGGDLNWSLKLSLLIPAFLMVLAAAFFIHGYLRVRSEALRRFLSKARSTVPVTAAGS